MKKILSLFTMLFLSYGFTEAAQINSSDMMMCSPKDLIAFSEPRYIDTSISIDSDPQILYDTQTIKIDKKKKTIEVWTVWLTSPLGRLQMMQKIKGFDNYGYAKFLRVFNYGSMTLDHKFFSYYNCDGTVLMSAPDNYSQPISPNSINEAIMKKIMEFHKLN